MSPAVDAAGLDVDLRVPERSVHLRLRVAPGRTTALIGPNGAGKSTLLGALAGTIGARGRMLLGGQDLSRRPAHRRGLGHLQQDAGLFTHLSVLENVAFGPRAHGVGREQARARAREMLAAVEAEDLADRRPRRLSGGQAQRVAIARALATDPAVLLLDEPFAALDAEVTSRLRTVLARMLRGRTALLVTHDLLDVLALADDVAVLEGGSVLAQGPREEILSRPPTVFAARLTGRFLVPGVLSEDDEVLTEDGRRIAGVPDPGCMRGQRVHALVDPARVRLEAARPEEPGAVALESVDRLGSHVLAHAGGIGAEVEASRALGMDLRPGAPVRLHLDPTSILIYTLPEDSRLRTLET